jgi:hypothetical protein
MSTYQLQFNGKSPPWLSAILKHGFTPCNGGFRRDGLTLHRRDRWFTIEGESQLQLSEAEMWHDQLGQPGLWRWIPHGQRWQRVFEFPATRLGDALDDEEGAEAEDQAHLDAYLTWAFASQNGRLPYGWKTPSRELVKSWLPNCLLTVRCGSIVRQGELMLSQQCWALKFTILPALPSILPLERRQWLREVLADTLQQWRMVRLGFTNGREHPAVVAEVDFSGAPHSENLFSAGLNSLRHAAASLAETLEMLADSKVESEILAIPPFPQNQPEKK